MYAEDWAVSDRLMTYDELAEALGRSTEAVRAMVIRKRWRRTLGNDGKARVSVPTEALETLQTPNAPPPHTRSEPRAEARANTPAEHTPSEQPVIALLHARVAELAAELREARAATSEAQAKANRVEGLEALLAAERERVNDLKVERDRWAGIAEASQKQITHLTEPRRGWWPFRKRT
jgi:hypothetical protein